jgi:hypothetical protein
MKIERTRPPKYWRMRAEEFRTKADHCQNEEVKESLRNAAKNYEELLRCRCAAIRIYVVAHHR